MPSRRNKSKRSIIRRKNTSAERLISFAKRFGVILGVLVFIGWLGAWFFTTEANEKTAYWANEKLLSASASLGFSVKNLMVEGREYTDADAILAIANVRQGDPLFAFDVAEAQKTLEKLSWVKKAHVERRMPDTIYIEILERKPFALWQNNKRLTLIDDEGMFLTDHKLGRFKDLMIVVGKDAPQESGAFLSLLNSEPSVRDKVESARHVAGRRWDLALKNGVIIKLPESESALALTTLAHAQENDALLDKDIKTIDMREQGRIVVQTHPGAVQEYKASYQSGAVSGDSI